MVCPGVICLVQGGFVIGLAIAFRLLALSRDHGRYRLHLGWLAGDLAVYLGQTSYWAVVDDLM
jgi:hypothetical protein